VACSRVNFTFFTIEIFSDISCWKDDKVLAFVPMKQTTGCYNLGSTFPVQGKPSMERKYAINDDGGSGAKAPVFCTLTLHVSELSATPLLCFITGCPIMSVIVGDKVRWEVRVKPPSTGQ
jgi:hypothetical protein